MIFRFWTHIEKREHELVGKRRGMGDCSRGHAGDGVILHSGFLYFFSKGRGDCGADIWVADQTAVVDIDRHGVAGGPADGSVRSDSEGTAGKNCAGNFSLCVSFFTHAGYVTIRAMKLRSIEFGPVIGASGVNGWFGEGYFYHRALHLVPGFTFAGVTFTAKTTTFGPRAGNMPFAKNGYSPREIYPACIVVRPGAGVVLNAVGLGGPGLKFLLDIGRWQKIEKPFLLSFSALAKTKEERLEEMRSAAEMLRDAKADFRAPFALQINFSSPNSGHDQRVLAEEIHELLAIASTIGVPLVPKISVLIAPDIAGQILRDPNCDALCVSNAVPWKDLPPEVRKVFFQTQTSPLERFGGGGISGKYLLPLVVQWLDQFRKFNPGKPVIAGGGILRPRDVDELAAVGASAVSPGSVVMLRPWNMRRIIKRAYELL